MSTPTPPARRPLYRLTADDQDVTARLQNRLIRLSLTDNQGLEADTLEITLADADGKLPIPRRGVVLHLWLGWEGRGLIDKGRYTVDETEHSGSPDQLTIRARSADLRSTLHTRHEASYHRHTLGKVLRAVARRSSLQARVHPSLDNEPIDHLDQTNETDAHLLTRLSEHHDALISVKGGHLLATPAGSGQSASGQALAVLHITRRLGDRHRFTVAEREAATNVEASYYDRATGKQGTVTADASQPGPGKPAKGSAPQHGNVQPSAHRRHRLRHVYASKSNATRAAKSQATRRDRGRCELEITLAHGIPELTAEVAVTVSGYKPEIDAVRWGVKHVTHDLAELNYTCRVQLEAVA